MLLARSRKIKDVEITAIEMAISLIEPPGRFCADGIAFPDKSDRKLL
jgi:hypothetical protein